MDELHRRWDEAVAAMQETWRRATGGHRGALVLDSVSMTRSAARVLAEWSTARKAHPEGSSLADIHFTEASSTRPAPPPAWLLNRAGRRPAAIPPVDEAGEGRAALITRTTGATGGQRRTH
ncbi:hypothetical protein ACIOGZ_29340 [Kitasatospora sp. NPDC088160]|uniref:hypothetical protein n=1 Tax=Kitasatospora sp. NPDC088160 TaxID=3364072 RepID=UPI00381BB891